MEKNKNGKLPAKVWIDFFKRVGKNVNYKYSKMSEEEKIISMKKKLLQLQYHNLNKEEKIEAEKIFNSL